MAQDVRQGYQAASGDAIAGGRLLPLPAWVLDRPLDEWYSIPNTALSSCPPTGPAVPGITGPSSKISAWCGATLRRARSEYMLGAAGGHADYTGNEVNTLVLNTATPTWVETKARSLPADVLTGTPVYLDLRRSALHTYWSTQYDNVNDQMLLMTSGGPNISGVPTPPPGHNWISTTGVLMGFDRALNEWTHPDLLPRLPWGGSGSGDVCCTNGVTGEIFYVKPQGGWMHKYSPLTQTWSTVGAYYLPLPSGASAIDPVRNRMLIIGDFSLDAAPRVRSTLDAAAVAVTFGGLGPEVLTGFANAGLVYDEARDEFVAFINTSPITVYRINAATYEVSAANFSGVAPAQRSNGVLNSVQYVPELKGIVMANSYTDNVKFVRTAL